MTPLLISVLAFLGVTALVGMMAFVFGGDSSKMVDRLDTLTGRKRKEDEATNILRKTAFERDKKSLLELLTPNLPSLAAGMHVVAEEMPSPIADEFGRGYEEQNLGIAVEDALKGMCERVPNLDLRFFVTSVLIQRQTGGDLAEILDKIGYVVRERYRILGQVKALTGEGRLSGVVLIALPFALFLFMLHVKPDYISLLWTDELGIKMLVAGTVMQIVGALVIKKIVDIKV